MSDYVIDDPEYEIECPYDKSHMVRRKRMQYHLIKCRKNHVNKDFAVCPFNATHEMPKPELRHHMLTCRDRAVAEKTIRHEEAKRSDSNQSILKGNTDVPAYNTYQMEETEDWDSEIPSNPKMGVDPSFFHMNTRRSLAGLTPLEKRQFHTSLIPDMADYNMDEDEEYRPVGMAPEPKEERKVRLPKAKSQAETLYEQQKSQVRPPKAPSSVFQYSLAMAGVGRGRGMLSNPPPPLTRPGGRGMEDTSQAMPASLQAYSMKNAKPNRESPPPANIMAYVLKNGKKASSISSNNSTNASADNSSNEAFSDDEDFDGVKPQKPQVQAPPGQNSIASIGDYVLNKPGRSRGRGTARRQKENEVYVPPVMKPMQNTGIGRGARLQNGNLQPEHMVPSNPNSWASLVTDSRRSTPPPTNGYNSNDFPVLNQSNDFPTLNQSNDFPTLNQSNDFPTLNQSNNGQLNNDEDDKSHCNDEILELAKKQSKMLRKKLVGISKLEEKMKKKGVKLTPDELAKVNRKSEFEKELANLSITE